MEHWSLTAGKAILITMHIIESFHATLKKELIYNMEVKSYEETRGLLFEYIESWYNNERIQKRLGYLSPTEYLRKSP